jgi:hypothetical protein
VPALGGRELIARKMIHERLCPSRHSGEKEAHHKKARMNCFHLQLNLEFDL